MYRKGYERAFHCLYHTILCPSPSVDYLVVRHIIWYLSEYQLYGKLVENPRDDSVCFYQVTCIL